ncbi:MAG: V-type ATP synthase subunit I [Nanobdellota archaeon]
MATDALYQFSLLGRQEDKQRVIDYLHEKGIIHVRETEQSLSTDMPVDVQEQVSAALLELRWLIERLKPYTNAKEEIFTKKDLNTLLHSEHSLKGYHHEIESLTSRHTEVLEELETLQSRYRLLRRIPFKADTDLSVSHTGPFMFTMLVRGKDVTPHLTPLRDRLTLLCRDDYVLIAGLKSDQPAVHQAVQSFENIEVPELKGNHREVMTGLRQNIRNLKKERKQIEHKLTIISTKIYQQAYSLYNDLVIYHERYSITHSMHKTEQTFLLEGYVSQRNIKDIKDIIQIAKVHISIEDTAEGPSKLHNAFYVKHFEFITKMFGLPRYGALDPTVYLSVFIPIFFGFMFSDMGYGILLALLAGWILAKADESKKIFLDAGMVLLTCAITTTVFGWFFGSFFGDLLNLEPLLFDPFQNAKMILVFSLGIGLAHINLGLLLGIYANRHKGKVLLYDYVSLLSLQAGAFLLAFGKDAGFVILGFAVVLLLIRQSLMGLMEITKFMGAWFSYARLLALCLATAGIALGVNIMAEKLLGLGLFGPVLFTLMLIVGHLFNFIMNVLGSSIHSVRLHYIEFFSRFYEGNGEPFIPYTTLKTKETL